MTKTSNIVIAIDNVGDTWPCAICGGDAVSQPGPNLVLRETNRFVCRRCGLRHEPYLQAIVDFDNQVWGSEGKSLEWWAGLAQLYWDKVCPYYDPEGKTQEGEGFSERMELVGHTEMFARLSLAFEQMARKGLFVRESYWCCQTCALDAVAHEAKKKHRGYVFYHKQDAERLATDEGLYLSFGSLSTLSSQAVGEAAVRLLKKNGLDVTWSGKETDRIQVNGAKDE